MSEFLEFTYPSSDTVHTIHAAQWRPEGPVRAVVQIVHGLSEYIARYDHVARFLNAQGILVCGEDHLGHGQTARNGTPGYFAPRDGWELVLRDIRSLRLLQGEKYPGIPYVMLGHSMGSFLTRNYLFRWPGDVDGAVLSGTGQESAPLVAGGKLLASVLAALRGGTHVSPLLNAISLGAYNKPFAPSRTRADWISRDTEVVDRYVRDPLCSIPPTCAMFRDMMGGLQAIARPENLARMDKDTPLYFLSGDQDPVGAMGEGVRKVVGLFEQAGCRQVTCRLYPGARHELFNETNRQEVLDDLLVWLEGIL